VPSGVGSSEGSHFTTATSLWNVEPFLFGGDRIFLVFAGIVFWDKVLR